MLCLPAASVGEAAGIERPAADPAVPGDLRDHNRHQVSVLLHPRLGPAGSTCRGYGPAVSRGRAGQMTEAPPLLTLVIQRSPDTAGV
jgi:hypothetical protein